MRQALELALEALKKIDEAMPFPVAKLAQKAIKEALAQPEQEPVALKPCWYESKKMTMCPKCGQVHAEAIIDTTPPQRKPLTDEQIEQMWERTGNYDSFAHAIEAAHGIKE